MLISLDLYQTMAVAVVVYSIGVYLRHRIRFLEDYCIPAPVIGGVIFSLLTLVLHVTDILTISIDETMKKLFMTLFFTTVGYTASLKLLKKGGLQVILFTLLATVLVVCQNTAGVLVAKVFGINSLLGLCVGSIPMIGGHGTAGAFGPLLDNMGVDGASTVTIAAATFGLIMGGIIGGPVSERLIRKHSIKCSALENEDGIDEFTGEKINVQPTANDFLRAFSMIFVAAGLGSVVSALIQKTGLTFPSYIGAMLTAAVIRNIFDAANQSFGVLENIVEILGDVSLALFLALALMGLKLWQLADLAVPMFVMLLSQTVLIILFAYFVVFRFMGRDYEAAVMSSAACGFGMGATPNAIANMQAVTAIHGPAYRAFFVVPLVGSLFIDFINGSIITVWINFLH